MLTTESHAGGKKSPIKRGQGAPPASPRTGQSALENRPDDDEVIEETTTAKMVGVSRSKVQQMRADGSGPPFFKIGAAVRYRRRAVREWLASLERRSTAEGDAA